MTVTDVRHARIHAFEPRSRANGPGARFVVWFQGCTLGCPGCFNPATHAADPSRTTPVDPTGEDPRPAGNAVGVPTPRDSASPIAPTGEDPRPAGNAVGVPTPPNSASPIDQLIAAMAASGAAGLSLSGGEPLQQPEAALALLDAARALGMSTLAFSGYTIDEIRALPGGGDVLARLDVLIDGRYVAGDRLATGLRGSANQRIHLLTDRHTLAEVEATPVAEIRIGPGGEMILTGVDPLKLKPRPPSP